MKDFYSKVFFWLFLGLLITFSSGYVVLHSPAIMKALFSSSMYVIIFLLQIILCIWLTARIHSLSPTAAKGMYIGYTVLTGLTFSSIFLMFQFESILFVFLVTALLFGLFAFLGKITNIDLSKISSFLLIGLIGVILLEVINIFVMNHTLDMVSCIISIIVFLGYVAFDFQKVRVLAESGEESDNYAIIGAFELYLDFINIFVDLIRLLGKSRD